MKGSLLLSGIDLFVKLRSPSAYLSSFAYECSLCGSASCRTGYWRSLGKRGGGFIRLARTEVGATRFLYQSAVLLYKPYMG